MVTYVVFKHRWIVPFLSHEDTYGHSRPLRLDPAESRTLIVKLEDSTHLTGLGPCTDIVHRILIILSDNLGERA